MMTVKELIAELEKVNGDCVVAVSEYGSAFRKTDKLGMDPGCWSYANKSIVGTEKHCTRNVVRLLMLGSDRVDDGEWEFDAKRKEKMAENARKAAVKDIAKSVDNLVNGNGSIDSLVMDIDYSKKWNYLDLTDLARELLVKRNVPQFMLDYFDYKTAR